MSHVALYWSRRDFRLTDNPALTAAVKEVKKEGGVLCPVFVLENYMCAGDPAFQFGYPQRLFLSKALPAYTQNFKDFLLLKGTAVPEIKGLCDFLKASGLEPVVYVNEDVYPDFYSQVAHLRDHGIAIRVFADQMTIDPKTTTETGKYYSVFTPFKKTVWKSFLEAPVLPKVDVRSVSYVPTEILHGVPSRISIVENSTLEEFSMLRTFAVHGSKTHVFDISSLAQAVSFDGWYASEKEAQDQFRSFCTKGLRYYAGKRDSLAADVSGGSTSRMSLALTWGLVSARYLKSEIQKELENDFVDAGKAASMHLRSPATYLSELIWREFYKYLFFHNPSLMDIEFQERFRGTIQWVEEKEALRRFEAWIKGETGYPIVDAAMKQIAQMGWMHNRSRMVVASVLTKNLGVDWRWGQEYFRAQLFDLDEASNNGGWQWGASVGADPKPIRIFNPYLQAKNYDPDGAYQKRWLGAVPQDAKPIVEHALARTEALARYGLRYSRIGLKRSGNGEQSMF